MSDTAAWYKDERLLIPLAILIAGLALLALKPLLANPTLRQTIDASVTAQAEPDPSNVLPMPSVGTLPAPEPVQYTDLTGNWSARYTQVGDSGEFSEFHIEQSGDTLTGEGATRSEALNDTARYTISGSVDGREVRFVDQLVEQKFGWCEGCQYVGTVNEELTRIELRATCPGLCPGGTMVLTRMPPEQPPVLL